MKNMLLIEFKKYTILLALICFGGVSTMSQDVSFQADSTYNIQGMPQDSTIAINDFSQRVLLKIERLGKYISIIGDKQEDPLVIQNAIDLAVALFIDEDRIVQISSLNNPGDFDEKKVRDYFERLMLLNYSKVKIEWVDIGYISNLKQDPDGNFDAVVRVKQKFIGYQDDVPVYKDITTKDILVKLRRKPISQQDGTGWEIKLSDLKVNQTLELELD